jgi:hypothetical protein
MDRSHQHPPKLLMVTSFAPNPVGGALMYQLLEGYPRELQYWWTCSAAQPCGHQLGPHQLHACPIPERLQPYRRWVRLKSWLIENLYMPLGAAHLRRVARAVQPDLVWCQLTGWAIPILWKSGLLDTHRTHATLWDYHSSLAYQRLGRERAERLTRLSEQIMARATTCDVVSVAMQQDLAARIGRPGIPVIHSGLEPWQFEQLAKTVPPPSSTVRIAYSGSIIAPDTFNLFVRALGSLRQQRACSISLELFSRSFRNEPWFDPEWMVDHGLLDQQPFLQALDRCSWGFLPMHLDNRDDAYNRFSLPNKFGSTIAAGLPLMVLAHRESTAAKMFEDYPVGVYSDATDLGGVVAWLDQALAIHNPRQVFRSRILECAHKEFDAAEMRRRLWACWGINQALR